MDEDQISYKSQYGNHVFIDQLDYWLFIDQSVGYYNFLFELFSTLKIF